MLFRSAIDQAQTDSEKALADLQAAAADSAEQALLTELRERATRFFAAVAKFRSVQKDGAPEDARESLIVDLATPGQRYREEYVAQLLYFEGAVEQGDLGAGGARRAAAFHPG